jgi:hypothetical protein
MTDRLEELVWVESDGELSAEEARELAELRVGSAEAGGVEGGLESEVHELATVLSKVEDVEAPPALKQRILAAIEPGGQLADEPRGSRPEAVAQFPTPAVASKGGARWRRWGYLAAAVLIGAVALYHLVARDQGSENTPELVGTVAPAADPGHPPDSGQRLETPDFARLTQRDGRLLASLELGEGDSAFVFRAPGLEVEQVDFENGASGSYEAGPSQITLRVAGPGRVEVRLAFARPALPITFSASGGDFEPFEAEFFLHQLLGS